MRRFACAGILLLLPVVLTAQTAVDRHQAFLDLSNECVLMDLSAHPDDEDGSTLALYRMKEGVKTYSVLFTRGEGGQNEKGPELYEELGVLRSAETEAAGRILGVDVRFLNLLDFGYSKTATEAFQKWGGRTEVLRRLVYLIRKLKPDVIFTNHNTIDGHGHHQAVAIIAIDAFDAAADSAFFPEQLKLPGVNLWQPRKLFFRVWGGQQSDVSNSIDQPDPARGESYLDVASAALKMHRTQGLDRANLRAFTRGKSMYKLIRANSIYEADSTSYFSGINIWDDPSVAFLRPFRESISELGEGMEPRRVLEKTSALMERLDTLSHTVGFSPLARRIVMHWEEGLERLSAITCGATASLQLKDLVVVARQRVPCTLFIEAAQCTLGGVRWRFDIPQGWAIEESPGSHPSIDAKSYSRDFILTVGDNPHLTLPHARAQYGSLETEEGVAARISYTADGRPLRTSAQAAFDVAPIQTLTIAPAIAGLFPMSRRAGVVFNFTIRNYFPHKTAGRLAVHGPPGWQGETVPYVIDAEDSVARGTIHLLPPEGVKDGEYVAAFRTDYASQTATVNVFDARVAPDLRVGIIESYDNTLEDALSDLHVPYSLLSENDLQSGDLTRYATIVVDIRAYLVREDLRRWNERLLDYVKGGGNLVVMYQRDQEWKPEYAPFPFKVTRRRVSVEEAPIIALAPDHPLLNSPNRIGEPDWGGWKQERGLYFPGDVSQEYMQLLSSHDPDESPLTTGYLVTGFGKGSYIYTSYVWYRQLKDHNPGAFRCFANMISYPAFRK